MTARPLPRSLIPLLLTLLTLSTACDSAPTTRRSTILPTVQMKIGPKEFTLEVADTDDLRQKGLMRRDSLPKDHGMIFIFLDEAPRSFWMKNTRIPLDIIYVDARGRIVSIKQMKPFDLNGTPSDGPAQYAIELNQNTAKDLGIKPGDTLDLPKGLKAKD